VIKDNTTYLLLGSNLGDRSENLRKARNEMGAACGEILLRSGVYRSKSWGVEQQPDYYNQVLQISTPFSPSQLLDCILDIESTMGRIRTRKWSSRIIDIDILFYKQSVIDLPGLQIPHPRIAQRNFTLVPLMEIAPLLEHPTLGMSIEELYLRCPG
jgi:2-amino-4-hydroxy-6-hydroxymethyldihydropteridine diphosphokinase